MAKEKRDNAAADITGGNGNVKPAPGKAVKPQDTAKPEVITKRNALTRAAGIKWDPDNCIPVNDYYMRKSKVFKVLKYFLIILTISYAMTMTAVFSEDITVENFRYLMKELDISALKSSDSFDKVIYKSASSSQFGLFKGDLCVAGAGAVNLYSPSGSSVFNKSNSFYSPVLLTGEKYFLICDIGDTSLMYTVYNSFSELHTEKMDYPISAAALSDSGIYAIATRSADYKGVVYIYNDKFKVISKIVKDKYIMDVELKADGSGILVLSAYESNSDFCAEIMTCSPYSDIPDTLTVIEDTFPIKAGFNYNGGFTVLCDDRLLFYDEKGTQTAVYDFSSATPLGCEIGGEYIILTFNKNVLGREKIVLIFNTSGDIVYNKDLSGEITDISINGNFAYILFKDRLVRVDISDGEQDTMEIESNCIDLVFSGDNILLCYPGSAYPVSFDSETGTGTAAEADMN